MQQFKDKYKSKSSIVLKLQLVNPNMLNIARIETTWTKVELRLNYMMLQKSYFGRFPKLNYHRDELYLDNKMCPHVA